MTEESSIDTPHVEPTVDNPFGEVPEIEPEPEVMPEPGVEPKAEKATEGAMPKGLSPFAQKAWLRENS
jgi:hypothetical protein